MASLSFGNFKLQNPNICNSVSYVVEGYWKISKTSRPSPQSIGISPVPILTLVNFLLCVTLSASFVSPERSIQSQSLGLLVELVFWSFGLACSSAIFVAARRHREL